MSQVIKKRRIVLASVLKPVDDTRMFEKIGATLAASGEFDVFVIGYPSSLAPAQSGIDFLPLKEFKRFSPKRFLTPWIIFKKINQVKPELIIINTPELLIVAILNRILFGRKIIYDVLENYYRNVRFTEAFPWLIRLPLAFLIRSLESITSPLVHFFLLAEKGYGHELRFTQPHIVLQNKLPRSVALQFAPNKTRGYSRLLFSGTLSPGTGVFDAIRLCKGLHEVDPSFSLTIIGYSAQAEVLNKIKKDMEGLSFISLIGGPTLVPHSRVLQEISLADWGVIIYPSNPSTQSSIPTKLFEYTAFQLPVLIRHNAESHELVKSTQAGIVLNETPDFNSLAHELKSKRFTPIPTEAVFWEPEGQKLIDHLRKL